MFALTCSRWGVFLRPSELTPLPSLVLFLEGWTFIIESRCWVDVNRTPDWFSFESWGGAEKGEPQAPPPPPHLFAVTQSASVHCPLTVCMFKSLSLLMTPLHQIPRAFVLGLLLCSFLILPRRLVIHETRCGIQMWWCASVCAEAFVPQSFLLTNHHTHRLFV